MGATQVETGGVKDDAVTSVKIPDDAIGTTEIADGAVTLAKLANGDNDSDGKVLTSNNGSAPTFNTPTVEGENVKSTTNSNEDSTKFLKANGDGTCSWAIPTGSAPVSVNGNGLAPQLPNPHGGKFLKADGTWTVPYSAVSGSDAAGLVPALPASDQTINFLRGDGSWAELNYTVSSTTTGDENTDASVSLSDTEFSFTIPRGNTGQRGPDGNAATVSVHSTETGDAGTNASVTNEGDTTTANFKFTIPRGDKGNQGNPGTDGKTILNGTSNPSSEGSVGDFFINTDSNEIFGPKDGSGWGTGTSLVGPAGEDGEDGQDGQDGQDGADGADGGGLFTSYARLEDKKSYNVYGGSSSAGLFHWRDINTERWDPDGIVLGLNNISTGTTKSNGSDTYSVSTPVKMFALGAGTYTFRISCPAVQVGRTFFYVRQQTTAEVDDGNIGRSTIEYSKVSSSSSYVTVRPQYMHRFTISATKLFGIRHYTEQAATNIGFGINSNNPNRDSIYTVIEIYKE